MNVKQSFKRAWRTVAELFHARPAQKAGYVPPKPANYSPPPPVIVPKPLGSRQTFNRGQHQSDFKDEMWPNPNGMTVEVREARSLEQDQVIIRVRCLNMGDSDELIRSLVESVRCEIRPLGYKF